jgi:hypothetical protein
MALTITVLTDASLTASVVGNGILATITQKSATLTVGLNTPGASATVEIGTTTTGSPGTDALVTNSGTASHAVLDFTIPRGDKGEQGNKGDTGNAAVVNVGTTTTLSAGSSATVTNSGTSSNAVFNFGIPQGIQGQKGDKGDTGSAGSSATVQVGTTTTLSAGSDATVTNSGSTSAAVFNFGIPQGIKGDKGDTGDTGAGVATGGTAGQVLAKIDGTDYNTEWITPSSGGGTWGSITGTLSSQTDLQAALDGKLSLTGGKMTGNIEWEQGEYGSGIFFKETTFFTTILKSGFLNIYANDGSGNDSQVWAGGFGVENPPAGQTAYLEPQQIRIYDNDHLTGTSLNGTGITFNDETTQVTAYDSAVLNGYVPINSQDYRHITREIVLEEGGTLGYLDIGGDGDIGSHIKLTSQDAGGSIGLYTTATDSFVKFKDGSQQNTTGLPITGGTMTGNLVYGQFGVEGLNWLQINENGIRNEYNGGSNSLSLNASGLNIKDDTDHSTGTTLNAVGITFNDSTQQVTAFSGYNGTTSQYIRGDGSLYTFPPLGDRYLTSSTSTLTCDSSNGKTMTVGTGLSYSRQQDITVSYSNAVHMHGTVLTYDSVTGVMTFDSNTHSGSGTYSNWEVNVGGVAGAVLPVGGTAGQVLAKINSTNFNTEWVSLGSASTLASTAILLTANNLSDLASSSTARTNLGLGTMATQPASAYLSTSAAVSTYLTISNASSTYLTQSSASSTYTTKANNLSDLASASTARTNLGLGAVATDSYATTAQAQAGTSTTSVISPATLLDAKFFAGFKPLSMVYTWTSSVAGVGASTTSNGQVKNVFSATAAIGSAMAYIFNYNTGRGIASAIGADFTKRTTIGGRFIKTVTTADANSVFRFLLGKGVSSPPAGDLASRGIGFRQVANGALELQVHNGTSLFNVTSSFTPTANQAYDVVIVADSGTATMYVNGSSVATSANAPTATLGSTVGILDIEAQNTSVLSGSAMTYSASDMFVQTNL